ncbi:MAG: hypothetical protein IAE79_17660 [Anaerolinea sp.]|nr:hypothetical protein [Anaerolinea sp.]
MSIPQTAVTLVLSSACPDRVGLAIALLCHIYPSARRVADVHRPVGALWYRRADQQIAGKQR